MKIFEFCLKFSAIDIRYNYILENEEKLFFSKNPEMRMKRGEEGMAETGVI